ncbi:hypothetical protein [Ornithinimicrobium cryptoxanthini]|uniref:Zn-dependent protease with chaperone function n=1 Tax=Ornithinimicrobium cryptoxanthini TaxID=2934161 RepID=A0ABY4YNJ6_9MICO|nr:hypothetical protein [Ornithinimicrobium cryptoxanthini]USQ77825.1 hypothetical protein NF557_08025 [Ornithinimicrobium cryptoxanthini]
MTAGRARRAYARVMIVPMVMSAAMWLVVAALVARQYWPAFLLVIVPVLAIAASTPVGERCQAVFMWARAPRLHQRHTLGPVAQVLLEHGVESAHLTLLVGPSRGIAVTAVGRRIIVVSRGLIEDVRLGHLSTGAAAAVVAHEVGVMRAGLTRSDPAIRVLLAPWKVWLTFIALMWAVASALIPRWLMLTCLLMNAGAGIWLGATQDPAMFVSTACWAVVLWTWWTFRSWSRARHRIGDHYLVQTGLARVYAQLLVKSFTDDYTRDRAVRLQHPEMQGEQVVVPGEAPRANPALSTTAR